MWRPLRSDWLPTVRTSSKLQTHTLIWRSASIKAGERPAELRSPSDGELNTRQSAMTPSLRESLMATEQLSSTNKLRKPMVEKMRRERINGSIEKLKLLLAEEFLQQQPDSRQEKADILEMTVDFLRRQSVSSVSSAAQDGHGRCLQEAVHFLSRCPAQSESHRRLLKLCLLTEEEKKKKSSPTPAAAHGKQETPAGLWRPW